MTTSLIAAAVALPRSSSAAGPPSTLTSTLTSTSTSTSTSATYTWGRNTQGEVGDGTTSNRLAPQQLTLSPTVTAVAVSAGQSEFDLALGSDSKVYVWGGDDGASLGGRTPRAVPLPGGVAATAVSAGFQYSLAIGADGVVYAWGQNSTGQLGTGNTTATTTPTAVALPSGDPAVAVSAGQLVSLALGASGQVYAWGDNSNGELGNGLAAVQMCGLNGCALSPVPVHLPGGEAATAIAAGGLGAMALGANGVVYSWGADFYDQDGIPSSFANATCNSCVPTPIAIALPSGVSATAITNGSSNEMAVGSDGNIYAWGNNLGQLGDNSVGPGDGAQCPLCALTPRRVSLPLGVKAVAISDSGNFSLAIGSDSNIYSWGFNSEGNLGNNTTTFQPLPNPVSLPLSRGAPVTAIAAGYSDNSIALATATSVLPVFTSASPPLSLSTGSTLTYQFAAAGFPAPAYTLTGPPWLSINQETGRIAGIVPAGTSAFTYSVTAFNGIGSATAGPFSVSVGSTVTITGTVVDSTGTPVAGAQVDACITTVFCNNGSTDNTGAFSVNALAGSTVSLTAYPPLSQTRNFLSDTISSLPVPAAGIQNETITLPVPAALPAGVTLTGFPGSGTPVLNWSTPATVGLPSCPNGSIGVSLVGRAYNDVSGSGSPGSFTDTVLTEHVAGSGVYTGEVPPALPIHGPAQLETTRFCPPLNALAPSAGPATGGALVNITGSGFTGATGVHFGNVPAAEFFVVSDNVVQAITPPGAGPVQVSVQRPTGAVVADTYTYVGIHGVTPPAGPPAGGTTVAITGSGLSSAYSVRFGTVAASYVVVSDTEILATSPGGQGTVDIQIDTTDGGTTPIEVTDQFSYVGVPLSSKISRRPAPAASPRLVAALRASIAVRHEVPSNGPWLEKQTPNGPIRAASRPAARAAPSVVPLGTEQLPLTELFAQYVWRTGPVLLKASNITVLIRNLTAALDPSCKHGISALEADLGVLAKLALQPVVDGLTPVVVAGALAAFALIGPADIFLGDIVGILWRILAKQVIEWGVQEVVKAGFGDVCKSFDPNVRIDPSGTILDTNGNPIPGAVVTVLRSDAVSGPFNTVDPSSAGIDPHVNPEATGPDGAFHWDVSSGYYEIQATAAGCSTPGAPSQQAATIGPYPVPPPQVGLTVVMQCPNEAPAAQPTVASVDQNVGPPAGGTVVTITGTRFTPTSTVHFGGAAAISMTYFGPTTLQAVSPPQAPATAVDVVVTSAGGPSALTPADRFTFANQTAVTGIAPSNGPAGGGTTVRITGSGFNGAAAVFFGSLPAVSFSVVADGEILAVAPAQAAGPVDVVVNSTAGASLTAAADLYAYRGSVAPTFTASTPPALASLNKAFTYSFAATGTPAPTFRVSSGNLPPGLALEPQTGQIVGTPTAAGTYTFTVLATNGSPPDAVTGPIALSVTQAPTITTPSATTFTAGVAGFFEVRSAGYPTAGIGESGALPAGITFTDNSDGTATLSGTALSGTGGVWVITIVADNRSTAAISQTFVLTIDEAATFTSPSTDTFTAGTSGTIPVTTGGFPVPSLTAASMPAGVSFTDNSDGTGVITVSNTVKAGLYTIALTATNEVSALVPQSFGLIVTLPGNPLAVTLTASSTTPIDGIHVRLVARANQNLVRTGYGIAILDGTSNTVVASCPAKSRCTAIVADSTGMHTFRAVIVNAGTTVATSVDQPVTWAPATVSLSVSETSVVNGDRVVLVAKANENISRTPYAIFIVDGTTGAVIASCTARALCTTTITNPTGAHSFQAIIADASRTNIRASSALVKVTWAPTLVTLIPLADTTTGGQSVMLTATANQKVGPARFMIVITDMTARTVVISCFSGSSCRTSVRNVPGVHAYQATVVNLANGTVQASSPPTTIRWT